MRPFIARADIGGNFMIVEMEQNKIQRTILRQRHFVERSVDDPHIGHARLLHAIMQFLTRRGIGRIDQSTRSRPAGT